MSKEPVTVRASRIQNRSRTVATVIAAIGVIVAALVTDGFGLVAREASSTVPTQTASHGSNPVSQTVNVEGQVENSRIIQSGRDTVINEATQPGGQQDALVYHKKLQRLVWRIYFNNSGTEWWEVTPPWPEGGSLNLLAFVPFDELNYRHRPM